jgi:AraC family transcriptional regulator
MWPNFQVCAIFERPEAGERFMLDRMRDSGATPPHQNNPSPPPQDIVWGPDVVATIERAVDLPGYRIETRRYQWNSTNVMEVNSNWYCFTRVLAGSDASPAHWRLPGSRRFLAFGGCWVTPPNTPVEVRRAPGVLRSIVLRVDPAVFYRVTGLKDDWYDERLIMQINQEGMGPVRTLNMIAEELNSPGYASDDLLAALAQTFIVHFARMVVAGRKTAGGMGHWRLNCIRHLAETSPANTLTVERLAEECGISARHLMRSFKAMTGTTIHSYIEDARLERTRALLTQTALPLRSIAAEVGFGSPSHLSSVFSRRCGISPAHYRQRHKSAKQKPDLD